MTFARCGQRIALLAVTLLWALNLDATTVHFHAWGGSAQVNGYLQWANKELQTRHGITLNHVKLADTSDAVSRVLAEKSAGNLDNGSVDLIWINGENFAAMSQHQLLLRNWVNDIPHFALTRPGHNPAMTTDFGLPTRGQEAPWGRAAMVFYYNAQHLDTAPTDVGQLLHFARANPGRFTYPLPSDYLGVSFLKYVLLALQSEYAAHFSQPVGDSNFSQLTAPLWDYLDQLHPFMWRRGEHMVRQASALQRLMSNEELLLAFSFTAAEIPSAVARYDLPPTIRTYAMTDGSLANVHFIGISFNTPRVQAAKTVVNFLLSPEAQAKKQEVQVWGDQTVLDIAHLPPASQRWFTHSDAPPSALPANATLTLLAEPHASWTDALREAWFRRYGARL